MSKFDELMAEGGLSIERLQNFCKIVDAGGLARAAAGKPEKVSLFSRQIRELEGVFGVELKRRLGRGIVITEAGRQLAQLMRLHMRGLEDFHLEANKLPVNLSIATSNSLLEWVLGPQIPKVLQALPNITLELSSDRTQAIVEKLTDMSIDVGIIREDAVISSLMKKRLLTGNYSFFLPRRIAGSLTKKNLKNQIANIALATSAGGQFRDTLEAAALRSKWNLRIVVSCSSFTQAARVMKTGECGAVLPDFAAQDFDPAKIIQLPIPFLTRMDKHMCIAWNPRLAEVRKILSKALEAIETAICVRTPSTLRR